MNKVYLANYLTNAESFADYLNAGAADGYTLHSFVPSPNAGVWGVMEKSETDGATVFDFLRACTPERLDALETLLTRVDLMYPLSTCDDDPGSTMRAHAESVELLSALLAAVGRVSGGTETRP